jgi:glycosyltransferase involved in cell wall biosynthesis
MPPNHLVSIILPTYNGSQYLDGAIQSCVEQSYVDWELIIVDDASTDDTPDRIRRWIDEDDRIHFVRHPTNLKLPASLNTGFSLAKGDYLTWTSDDNLYRPIALEHMVAYLESNPGVDVVYTDYTFIDEAGNPIREVNVLPPKELVAQGNCIGPSFLYRKAVQEKLGGYAEDLFLAEDYDFWLRASIWFQLEPLHIDCYLYRKHGSSLTALQKGGVELATDRTLLRVLPQLGWVSDKIRGRTYLDIGLRLFDASQTSEAAPLISRAFIQYHILNFNPTHAMRGLLYEQLKLRSVRNLRQLLDFIPNEDASLRAFKTKVWGEYHATRCFEGYQNRERATVRHHLPRAIKYDLGWLRNRGFVRIALWAFAGLNS